MVGGNRREGRDDYGVDGGGNGVSAKRRNMLLFQRDIPMELADRAGVVMNVRNQS